MRVAVDPDVFSNATKPRYYETLSYLDRSRGKHCFIVTRELRARYGLVAATKGRSAERAEELACTIARHLANGTALKQLTIEPMSAKRALYESAGACVFTDTDRQLLDIAATLANARTSADIGPTCVLVLDCSDDSTGRCLCDESTSVRLCSEMNQVRALAASDPDSIRKLHVDACNLTNSQQHDKLFEAQCILWLGRRYSGAGSMGRRIKGNETDAYCQGRMDGQEWRRIGEAKLIHGGVDKVEPQYEAVQQLNVRIQALTQEHPGQTVDAFVFCNVLEDFDQAVRSRAQQLEAESGVVVHFVRVRMPSGWQKRPAWDLGDDAFEDIT